MSVAKQYDGYTIEDIYALPDGERAELIDGDMYMMEHPNRKHQELVTEISCSISNYIADKGGSCEVYLAPFAVFLNADDRTYVEPDISVICDRDKLNDKGCNGAPDWIIEITSPGTRRMDYLIKLFKYRSAGVKEYWVVDYEKDRITVYDFVTDNMEEYSFTDAVSSIIFDGFQIDFGSIMLG